MSIISLHFSGRGRKITEFSVGGILTERNKDKGLHTHYSNCNSDK